ncbi:hypothetical protein [Bacteroides sp.]|uniref:hypothetical protein n=1 Tax=Bacteroides sp. TaxID=29523 RepID=UPI0025C2EB0E|nr:hypothetical protein [Bacteroides sp.]
MDIDQIIKQFPKFLDTSWNSVTPLLSERTYTSNEDSINDWMQANWELLVERKILPLNEYLEVYGDGADFNGISSRITDINAIATHHLSVFIHDGIDLLTNKRMELSIFLFEKFVGFKAGFYTIAPPFKYVLVLDNNNTERVFCIEKTNFELSHY